MTSYKAEKNPADQSEQEQTNQQETKQETQQETKQESTALALPEPRLKANPARWLEVAELADMLSYCRPHNSKTERQFIAQYLSPIGIRFDKKGNVHKRIGNSPVIWSCHIDTVHNKKGKHKVVYWVDKETGDTFLGTENGSCLGADDTAGIFIMLDMIQNKVPGNYIFHRGEECGGVGSRWFARENKEFLKGIKFAIAFDRRDTKSIITAQGSRMCCSDEFAQSLAEQIGMGHECDRTGMWTDTAAYMDDVAECTNISVGYYNAHGRDERLNIDYLFKLRDAMRKVDVSKLAEKRKPGDNYYRHVSKSYSYGYDFDIWDNVSGSWRRKEDKPRPEGGFKSYELDKMYGYNKWYKWFSYSDGYWVPMKGVTPPDPKEFKKEKDLGVTKGWRSRQPSFFGGTDLFEMRSMIMDNPAIIADLLDGQGYGPLELKEYIKQCGGNVYENYYGL